MADKTLFNTIALILAAGVVIAGIIAIMGGPSMSDDQQKTLSVQGEATKKIAPDEAVVTFSVITEANTADSASQDNADAMEKVVSALKEYGTVQTQYYSVSPVYQDYVYNANTPRDPKIQFYRASNSVELRTTDLESVGKVIDVATKAGANSVQGVSFELSDAARENVRNEILGLAAENAHDRAQAMASGLDLRLDGVHSVSEGNVYVPGPYYARYDMAMESAAGKATTPVEPRDVEVTASVTVTYELH